MELGDCITCTWYDKETETCHNPDAEYMEHTDPDDGCTLWEDE